MFSKKTSDEDSKKILEEISSIKANLIALKEDVDKKTSEHEAEAKQSSKKASEYRNRSLESKEASDLALGFVLDAKATVEAVCVELKNKNVEAQEASKLFDEAKTKIEYLFEKSTDLDNLLSRYSDYELQVESLNSLYEQGEEASSKINILYSALSKKKKEVDDLHLSIFGYEDKDEETGESKHVDGLKDELEDSYVALENNIEEAQAHIDSLLASTAETNDDFLNSQSKKISEQMQLWKAEHVAASQKIKDLLPDALTAGLSHAFSEKRKSEIASGVGLNKVFNYSILGLVAVSLIPFVINAYFIHIGKEFEDIILDSPNLLASIIPLYIPFAWLAYSSSKKSNLSKRLVEEYTHKEVLSKTFEGLSSQIESIEEDSISTELRIKLLYNLLDVSAENPGKLISNYKSSDHPLFDVLKTSSRLEESFKKLEKVPGISKISELLNKRVERLAKIQEDNVEKAIEIVEEIIEK